MPKNTKYQLTDEYKAKILATMDEDKNLEYWDEIDDLFCELLKKLARYSYTDMGFYLERNWKRLEEHELTVSDSFLDAKFDIKQMVIRYLETVNKGWFPKLPLDD